MKHDLQDHRGDDTLSKKRVTMNTILSKILLILLLCATDKMDAMLGSQSDMDQANKPIITLNTIDNKITHPSGGGRIECFLNGQEIAIVNSGYKSSPKKVLFTTNDGKGTYPSIQRLNLETKHPMQEGFKELRLKLTFDRSHLGIVKNLSDRQQRPQEFHPVEDGKKYLLNVRVDNENEISAELVEDNQ